MAKRRQGKTAAPAAPLPTPPASATICPSAGDASAAASASRRTFMVAEWQFGVRLLFIFFFKK
jgi:hypothetical protein